MTRALSQDLRSRVIAAVDGGLSCNAAADGLASRCRVQSAGSAPGVLRVV